MQQLVARSNDDFPDFPFQDQSSSRDLKREVDEDLDWILELLDSALTVMVEIARWGSIVAKAILVAISLNLKRICLKTWSVNLQVRGRLLQTGSRPKD